MFKWRFFTVRFRFLDIAGKLRYVKIPGCQDKQCVFTQAWPLNTPVGLQRPQTPHLLLRRPFIPLFAEFHLRWKTLVASVPTFHTAPGSQLLLYATVGDTFGLIRIEFICVWSTDRRCLAPFLPHFPNDVIFRVKNFFL